MNRLVSETDRGIRLEVKNMSHLMVRIIDLLPFFSRQLNEWLRFRCDSAQISGSGSGVRCIIWLYWLCVDLS